MVFPALPKSLYTVIIVDQDAGVLGPIAHAVVANVHGSVLASTVGLNADNAGPYFQEPYNGPLPPLGSGCHRYNVIVYLQTPGMTPFVNMSSAFNFNGKFFLLNFNFPVWASQYGLTRVASQMWQTQNIADRTLKGACAAPVCLSLSFFLSFSLGSWRSWRKRAWRKRRGTRPSL